MSFIFNAIINAIREYLRDMSKRPLEKIEETLDISTLIWMLLYGSFPYPTAQQQVEEQIGNIGRIIEENPEQAKQGFTWLYRIGTLYRLLHVQPLWVDDILNVKIRPKEVKITEDYVEASDLLNYHAPTKLVTERLEPLKTQDLLNYSLFSPTKLIIKKMELLRFYDSFTRLLYPATRPPLTEQISLMDSIEKYISSLVVNTYPESLSLADGVNALLKPKTILQYPESLLLTDELLAEVIEAARRYSEYLTLIDEIGSETYSPLQALTLMFTESATVSDGQIQGYPYPEQPEISYMQYTFTEATQLTDLLKAIAVMVAPILSLVSSTICLYGIPYNNQRKLVRTSDGTLYCVYAEAYFGYWHIAVKKSVDNGETWTDWDIISDFPDMTYYDHWNPSIAVDSKGILHVVWAGRASGYDNFQIWYSKYDGTWHKPVRISTYQYMEYDDQWYPSIAVDSNDNLHVVWHGKGFGYGLHNQIWYAKYDGKWHTPVRISTYEGMHQYDQLCPCIAVDSNDNLHVVWYGKATGYDYNQIWHTKYDGIWHTPTRISTYSDMELYDQRYSCIAVDDNDNLHVVWHGKTTGYDHNQIWHTKYDGIWHTPTRISTYSGMENYDQYYPSIAVDSGNRLHVVWQGKAEGYTDYDKVWYAKYETSWETPECLQPTGQNRWPNIRWSRFPVSNRVTNRLDYVFFGGTAKPWDVMFASLFIG